MMREIFSCINCEIFSCINCQIFRCITCVYHLFISFPNDMKDVLFIFITSPDELKSCNVHSIKDDACGCILRKTKVNAECLIASFECTTASPALMKKRFNSWHMSFHANIPWNCCLPFPTMNIIEATLNDLWIP